MFLLKIVAVSVTLVSGIVLFIVFEHYRKGLAVIRAHGIEEPLPTDNKSRAIIFAWLGAFAVGVVLCIAAFY
jgi:hypothetical protein